MIERMMMPNMPQDATLTHIHDTPQENEGDIQQETIQLCIFELSDQLFGLSIFEVQEILEDIEISPVPTTPHFLRGVMNLRGDIVPIVDIREILQLPIKERTLDSRIMILTIKQVRLGILVDAIKEVRQIAKEVVQADTAQAGITDRRFISNIIQYNNGLLILLDVNSLYAAVQL
ncbi:hypothetical protein CSA56_09730 [candidate division KSB3 bacterium]|uniref:CheW-like domain-containing protein n=1 Tax=candidate division KSB3 bacterium TaxID=2044937 RepID=A0A2G6KDM8_9BACT|nr:MAG: hypothetical protein CSA56_09730 [candidate division KSB3 bacterium]